MKNQTPPWWFTALLIILIIPMLVIPNFLNDAPQGSEQQFLDWLYPTYVIASAVCAWICYDQRRAVSWILVALLVLTHAGMMAIKMDIA